MIKNFTEKAGQLRFKIGILASFVSRFKKRFHQKIVEKCRKKHFLFAFLPIWCIILSVARWGNIRWQDSSVGRAEDWKSSCPQFDSGSGHHFCFNSLIYNDLCIENTRKTRVFFRFKFSVWRIWRTGERHKAAKILRFAFPGDTAFMLKIHWSFAFQVKKK